MPDRVYLDTSAIVRYSLAANGSPHARDQKGRQTLQRLIDSDDTLAASPITLAEFSSVLYTHLRDDQGWLKGFDEARVDAAERHVMEWIAVGRIRVRNLGPRAFVMGMAYVAAISREHKRNLRAWDAIHLYEACRWSRESNDQQVVLATADSDFKGFLEAFTEFNSYVRVLSTTA